MRDDELRTIERALLSEGAAGSDAVRLLERRAACGDAEAAALLRAVLQRLIVLKGAETLRAVTARSAPALLAIVRSADDELSQRAAFALWDLLAPLRSDRDPQVRKAAFMGVGRWAPFDRARLAELLAGRTDASAVAWREVLAGAAVW